MFEHQSRNRNPLLVIAAIILAVGIVILLSNRPRVGGNPPPTEPPPVAAYRTLTGEYVCLPHKNSSGPQTLECALGIKADSGLYYALDMQGRLGSGNYINDPVGSRIKVSGTLVPIEAISSDHWQIYNIKGIMQVEVYEKL